jgi:transcription-repair coupling factor (superfamily II helicase)
LLEGAIEELKGEKEEDKEVELDLKVDAYIPENYISDSKQKIEIYKKIKMLNSESEIIDIVDELIDRFGDPPEVVMNLIDLSKLGLKARKLGIEKIKEEEKKINCYFEDMEQLQGEVIVKLIDKFPGKIKVRSAKKPVIGIRNPGENNLPLLKEILGVLQELVFGN